MAKLKELFKEIDGMEKSLKEVARKADPDKLAFIMNVGNRPIIIQNGIWQPLRGRLSYIDQKALEIFFGD